MPPIPVSCCTPLFEVSPSWSAPARPATSARVLDGYGSRKYSARTPLTFGRSAMFRTKTVSLTTSSRVPAAASTRALRLSRACPVCAPASPRPPRFFPLGRGRHARDEWRIPAVDSEPGRRPEIWPLERAGGELLHDLLLAGHHRVSRSARIIRAPRPAAVSESGSCLTSKVINPSYPMSRKASSSSRKFRWPAPGYRRLLSAK